MPDNYMEYLTKRRKTFTEWVECPSKFEKPQPLPQVLQNDAYNWKGGLGNGEFKNGAHTSWEKFASTMKTDAYRNTINGSMFPKRSEHQDEMWGRVSKKATAR